MIVTVAKETPHFYLNTVPITLTKLQEEFLKRAAQGTNATLAIRSDKEASVDNMLKVVQAAYAAKLKPQISIFVEKEK